jgi:tetratricopeptide (TPR) repeat protein
MGVVTATSAADVDGLLRQGDVEAAAHRNAAALKIYLAADSADPDNPDILRRIANQYSQQTQAVSSHQEKVKLGESALAFAKRAVELAPKSSANRLTLAICYGRVALHESPRKKMEYSRLIKVECEAALDLDPQNDYAWHVLGRWNYEMAALNPALRMIAGMIYGGLPDASFEKAAECFERAVAIQPRSVIHQVELGRTYLAMGRLDDARKHLEIGLSLPIKEDDDAETQALARKALDSI